MKLLNSFLDKFKKKSVTENDIKTVTISEIKSIINQDISKNEIYINLNNIYIKTNSILKSEIIINKNLLLDSINQKISPFIIKDIK